MTLISDAGVLGGNPTEGQFKVQVERLRDFTSELLGGNAEVTLPISAGSITPVTSSIAVDTEGGATTDDLDNLLQPATQNDGKVVFIRSVDAARIVSVRHARGGAGQIILADNRDLFLDSPNHRLILYRLGTSWIEMGRFVQKGFLRDSVLKTADYTITTQDDGKAIFVDATAGVVTITLPVPSSLANEFRIIVKKIDSSTNAVNVVGTIDGANPRTLATQFESVGVVTENVSWHVFSEVGVIPSGGGGGGGGGGGSIDGPIGRVLFTNSGIFTVPAGVNIVWVSLVGGGSGGGGTDGFVPRIANGGGGGSGDVHYRVPVSVTPGEAVNITIGGGGLGGTSGGGSGAGGVSSFGTHLSANGGGTAQPGQTLVSGGLAGGPGGSSGQGGYAVTIPTGPLTGQNIGIGGWGGANILGSTSFKTAIDGMNGSDGVGFGSGGHSSGANGNGGQGAPGMAFIEWGLA